MQIPKCARLLAVFIFCGALVCSVIAQPPPAGTSSIRGTVLLVDQPLPGLVLTLQRTRGVFSESIALAETDADGNYQFNNIQAGAYTVRPVPQHLISSKAELYGAMQTIAVAEGETMENVNLTLQRGGVVTGKVTDINGNPIIGQRMGFECVDAQGRVIAPMQLLWELGQTDDRGVYRLFGLMAGQYRIYFDDHTLLSSLSASSTYSPRIYYPAAQHAAQAQLVEVTAGAEVTGIDIKLTADRVFQVKGRVIDAQTGAPLPAGYVGYSREQLPMIGRATIDERGEFRYEGFPAGRYSFFAFFGAENEYYSEQTPVEVKGGDVEGVVVKVRRGATISGWVTFEGAPEAKILAQIPELKIYAMQLSPERRSPMSIQPQNLGADGSIVFKGLAPGRYWFRPVLGNGPQGFNLVRIEHQGTVQDGGIEVVPGKNLNDVRLVIAAGTGSIRGRIQKNDESIELPESAFMRVRAVPVRSRQVIFEGATRADRRENFTIDGLTPGDYEVSVTLHYDTPPVRQNIILRGNSKVITVKPGESTEVVLRVELFR